MIQTLIINSTLEFSSTQDIEGSPVTATANISIMNKIRFSLNNQANRALLLDFHPFSNGFVITTGLMYNHFDVKLNYNAEYGANANINLGGDLGNFLPPIPPYQLGEVNPSINARIKSQRYVTPYFGIGYSRVAPSDRGFSPYIDIGFYLFKANLNYNVTCTITLATQKCVPT